MNTIERILLTTETVVHMWSAKQLPVEPIGPAVIAALDPSGEMPLGAGADARATMPAHVEKRPHQVILAASNNQAFPGNLAQKIIARSRDLIGAPRADP